MNGYQNYVVIAACFTFYQLGWMHARGHDGWKHAAAALVCGLAWPVMLAWGIWLAHFDKGVKK